MKNQWRFQFWRIVEIFNENSMAKSNFFPLWTFFIWKFLNISFWKINSVFLHQYFSICVGTFPCSHPMPLLFLKSMNTLGEYGYLEFGVSNFHRHNVKLQQIYQKALKISFLSFHLSCHTGCGNLYETFLRSQMINEEKRKWEKLINVLKQKFSQLLTNLSLSET